jgi:tRNA1Val (adenine37-N6)-methyltransferase
MKVGTDGALLGAWADGSGAKTILDAGTGSGLIALMLAQRSNACIDAIDTDADACRQAESNFNRSPFAARLQVWQQDFLQYRPEQTYDLIVSNPPYFMDSLPSPDRQRTLARHAGAWDWAGWLTKSYQLLSAAGCLSLILPAGTFDEVQDIALQTGFYPVRKTEVSAVENRPPKRVLLEYAKTVAPFVENRLCIETAGRAYSTEYAALMRPYYLKI